MIDKKKEWRRANLQLLRALRSNKRAVKPVKIEEFDRKKKEMTSFRGRRKMLKRRFISSANLIELGIRLGS